MCLQDLLYTTVLAAAMGLTEPAADLSNKRPQARLFALPVLLPVAAQLVVLACFQVRGCTLLGTLLQAT